MRGEFGVPVPQVRRWQVAEVAYDPENDDDADAEGDDAAVEDEAA